MPPLHEILTAKRDEILRCYCDQVIQVVAPNVVSREDILDHMPPFLDNAIAELQHRARAPGDAGGGEQIAVQHGVQRFELGFDIDALVRDYGLLNRCILDVLEQAGASAGIAEHRVLSDFLIEGIALAVSAYIEQRDAAQREQSRKHFAFLAHELRNQLSNVSLAVRVLDTRGVSPDTKVMGVVHRGLARLHEMVNGALVEASLDAGVTAQREHLVLVELLREASEDSAIDAESRQITVTVKAAESVTIEADPKLLRSAVTNLLRNAVKFTQPASQVFLRGGLRPEGGVFIEVEDGCGGLAPGAIAKIFTPFTQASADRSGFGLGLAITRQAIEAQGGSITVRDLPGQGCVFAIDFPRP
jgi:hypothetical protein